MRKILLAALLACTISNPAVAQKFGKKGGIGSSNSTIPAGGGEPTGGTYSINGDTGAATLGPVTVNGPVTASGAVSGSSLKSTASTGTPPLTVSSTTQVPNLNASLLTGYGVGASGAAIPLLNGTNTWANTQIFTSGILQGGTAAARFENTGAVPPFGSSGQGLSIFKIGLTSYDFNTSQYGLLYLNGSNVIVGLGKLMVGDYQSVPATSDPAYIDLGTTYSNSAGNNLKLKLFNNNSGIVYGLGISGGQIDYSINTAGSHAFFVNGLVRARINEIGLATGNVSVAADGTASDNYAPVGVTRTGDGNNYAYYSMTRAGNVVYGMGISAANQITLGAIVNYAGVSGESGLVIKVGSERYVIAGVDNAYSLGLSTNRWAVTYSARYCYTATVCDYAGNGTPLGNVSAAVGSTYRRTDGGAGTTFYVKESGTDASGWTAK